MTTALHPLRLATVLATTLLAAATFAAAQQPTPATFPLSGHTVTYERFASTIPNAPILIELPGTSGSQSAFYRDQARFYAAHGYDTLLLDYFSATASHSANPANYQAWSDALTALVKLTLATTPTRPVYVLGYSLGASIALAAGSQSLPVQAIAEWYGSLPDEFFYKLQATQSRMPPLLILHGQQDSNIPSRTPSSSSPSASTSTSPATPTSTPTRTTASPNPPSPTPDYAP